MAMTDQRIPISRASYTLEVTGKDIAQVGLACADIPKGTPINIAFLGNEDHNQRVNAARVIRELGFEPVPIISSRRIQSTDDLDTLLAGLIGAAAPARFLFVGGDPQRVTGPFADSLELLASGVLQRYAIRDVGIVGYPEGHPKIDTPTLWNALRRKVSDLQQQGCTVEITTQFGFDAAAILRWIAQLREMGIDCPVRVGVPGPTDVGKLLRFARQFGVMASAGIVRRYGFSLTNLLQTVGPEQFVADLAAGAEGRDLGTVLYHLYPFGGMVEAVQWMNGYLARSDHT